MLDIAGLVPGAGEIVDAANAGIYALRGDYLNAGLSLLACIPFGGWAATGGKFVNKSIKVIDKADDIYDAAKGVGKIIEGGLDVLSKPSSKALRQNMIEAGLDVPDYANAAHHIVAGSSPKVAEARAILQKFGVDINDATNGVFLPTVKNVAKGAYHPSLHTDSYYRKVSDLLSGAKNKNDVLDILDDIADQLSKGTFK